MSTVFSLAYLDLKEKQQMDYKSSFFIDPLKKLVYKVEDNSKKGVIKELSNLKKDQCEFFY